MKNRLIAYFAIILLLISFLEGCAVVNTMVSLKYETGYPVSKSDCVSSVTGTDLCRSLKYHKTAAVSCLLSFAAICGVALLRKKPEA